MCLCVPEKHKLSFACDCFVFSFAVLTLFGLVCRTSQLQRGEIRVLEETVSVTAPQDHHPYVTARDGSLAVMVSPQEHVISNSKTATIKLVATEGRVSIGDVG